MTIASLRWQCRRGMLELDLLLSAFLETGYLTLSEEEQRHFVEFLSYSDNQLFSWLTGADTPSEPHLALIVQKVRACKQ